MADQNSNRKQILLPLFFGGGIGWNDTAALLLITDRKEAAVFEKVMFDCFLYLPGV